MEHHDNVAVLPSTSAWSDVGSWKAVADLTSADPRGNRIHGQGFAMQSNNTFVHAPHRPVVVLGAQDLLVIDTPDNYREAYGVYACNGILFNHESPRRGETFVTRKITRGMANISLGLQDCLYMGNIYALRDWGHAKDYVRMQWIMLQQQEAEDFVIATGKQYSVRQFIEWSAAELGMPLRWEGTGVKEVGYLEPCDLNLDSARPIIRIDPRYFRPTEVETLLGDPIKAKQKLGWVPEFTAQEMCKEMVAHDLAQAKQYALLKQHGYGVNVSEE